MAVLRLFASVRDAAGRDRDEVPGATVGAIIDAAGERYGQDFLDQVQHCRIWVNGEPVALDQSVDEGDEVAVLPPVSGG